jgi:hypothetical protein
MINYFHRQLRENFLGFCGMVSGNICLQLGGFLFDFVPNIGCSCIELIHIEIAADLVEDFSEHRS